MVQLSTPYTNPEQGRNYRLGGCLGAAPPPNFVAAPPPTKTESRSFTTERAAVEEIMLLKHKTVS